MRLAGTSVLVVLLATTFAGCGARQLEAGDASRKIEAKISEQQPALRGVGVSCPNDVKAETGTTFVCTFSAAGGVTGEVQVNQTDDQGKLAIRYPAPPGTGQPTTPPTGGTTGGTTPAGSPDPRCTAVPSADTSTPPPAAAADVSEVILFTRTTGFRHDSIPKAVEVLTSELSSRGYTVKATDDPAVFTTGPLDHVAAIVFLETTGEVVDDEQQHAIEAYVRNGGGWAGVHSATDTEYDWPFYGTLAGARFAHHPDVQPATVVVEDAQHPSTAALPDHWSHVDEWYDFQANPRDCVHVLATVDEASYHDGQMGKDHPIIWCHSVDKGRSWYTALGHGTDAWTDPDFTNSVVEGIASVTPSEPDTCGTTATP